MENMQTNVDSSEKKEFWIKAIVGGGIVLGVFGVMGVFIYFLSGGQETAPMSLIVIYELLAVCGAIAIGVGSFQCLVVSEKKPEKAGEEKLGKIYLQKIKEGGLEEKVNAEKKPETLIEKVKAKKSLFSFGFLKTLSLDSLKGILKGKKKPAKPAQEAKVSEQPEKASTLAAIQEAKVGGPSDSFFNAAIKDEGIKAGGAVGEEGIGNIDDEIAVRIAEKNKKTPAKKSVKGPAKEDDGEILKLAEEDEVPSSKT
ncbi:MAG: hypothetical protein Q8N63_05085 [Nanoarchaeota archaeon]|nr:hypothetical protein [Nanoarchaeota archaeon]